MGGRLDKSKERESNQTVGTPTGLNAERTGQSPISASGGTFITVNKTGATISGGFAAISDIKIKQEVNKVIVKFKNDKNKGIDSSPVVYENGRIRTKVKL